MACWLEGVFARVAGSSRLRAASRSAIKVFLVDMMGGRFCGFANGVLGRRGV